ncbi:MAG: TonB-dependent receptor domain-containing protein, partial [Blastocatellia bacterium]
GRGGIEFNGAPALGNNILMDGVDASFVESHGAGAASGGAGGVRINTVSIEALQEFKTSSNAFSAEHGRATGGVINLTTKSGGRDFHGTAYDFLRNDAFDANTWNNNRRGGSSRPGFGKPAFRFNQFGGNIGGPVTLPEKYFGPLAFNEDRSRLFFFFNYEGVRAKSPQVQSGNTPTPLLLNAVKNPNTRAYLESLPKDCVSQIANNPYLCRHERNDTVIGNENTYLTRVDYQWGDGGAHRTAFRHSRNHQDADNPGALRRENRLIVPIRSHNVVIQDTWTVSPRVVNEFRIGYNRVFLRRSNTTYDTGFGGGQFGWTEVASAALTGDFASLLFYRGNTYSLTDNLTWIRGAHSLKFGVDIREVRSSRIQGTRVTHFFNSLDDLINDRPSNIRPTFGNPGRGFNSTEYGFYAQDDWRINRRFQINFGLRYDYYTPHVGSFNIADPDPFGPFAPRGTPLWKPDRNNLAPRLSLVYDVTGAQKLIVRAGGGINYAPQAHFNYYDAAWIDPRVPFNFLLSPSDPLPPGLTRAFPFPQTYIDQIAANPSLLPSSVVPSRTLTDPRRRDEYSVAYNLSLQYAVTKSLAVQATYAGGRGMHSLTTDYFNLIDPKTGKRPNTTIGQIAYIEGSGNNTYQSLQLSANYRLGQRITGDLYYTFAKNMVYNAVDAGGGPRQDEVQDFSNIAGSYGPKAGDIRHRVTGVYTFALPVPGLIKQNVNQGFGFINGKGGNRNIQFGLKYIF